MSVSCLDWLSKYALDTKNTNRSVHSPIDKARMSAVQSAAIASVSLCRFVLCLRRLSGGCTVAQDRFPGAIA